MFVDEVVVTRVETDGETITEEKIETRPEKLPGILVTNKENLQAVYKYMDDDDAVVTLYATIKAKEEVKKFWWKCSEKGNLTMYHHWKRATNPDLHQVPINLLPQDIGAV